MGGVDNVIMTGMGGLFLVIGIVLVVFGRREDQPDTPSVGSEARKYLESPETDSETTRIGGWITVAVGCVLLVMGVVFWLFNI